MNKTILILVVLVILIYGGVVAMGKLGKGNGESGIGNSWMPGKVKIYDYKTKKTIEVDKIVRTDEEYAKQLAADVCYIVRKGGTEAPFTGALLNEHRKGIFKCVACGTDLFVSDTKFESGTGWPSFFQPVSKLNIVELTDSSGGMIRTEVRCARCGSHLGHVFNDGPAPTGLRYCMNSKALSFEEIK
jgi:peptide-methionine (R)-S-oxide reductase